MIKIILCGACGRMGREIIGVAEKSNDIKIIAGIETKGSKFIGEIISSVKIFDDLLAVIKDADCVVEFTNPEATMENLKKAKEYKRPYVIGTTGFLESQISEIKRLADDFPILLSPNMSLGINFLYNLVKETTTALSDYEIEIIETHHRGKKDAPSGTAKAIFEVIKGVRPDVNFVSERMGNVGERKKDEVGIFAVRGGDVIGEHRVIFWGNGEFLELRHFATSRTCFAHGTLEAIRFIVKKEKGFYTMADLFNIER